MINPTKLDFELREAGIPIDGVSSNGRIDFRPEATAEQIKLAEQILANHDPNTPTPGELALKTAKEKAEANPVKENDIAQASTIEELRTQMLKMQAQIEYLQAQVKRLAHE